MQESKITRENNKETIKNNRDVWFRPSEYQHGETQ